MDKEQERILTAITTAIEMEKDANQCYLDASMASGNEAGRKFLNSLADEELKHKDHFEQIYESIRKNRDWPDVNLDLQEANRIRESLYKKCEVLGVNVASTESERDAVKVSVDKEKKSQDYYRQQAEKAVFDSEKEFYNRLAAEERTHELALLDYYEFLLDPAAWYVKREHPSLDGG